MANPVKPWKAEYAKSSRSSCRSCKNPIEKDRFRLGKMVASTQFDGFMPMWNHANCIFKKLNQIKSVDDVEGFDLLRWEDQQKLRQYVESGSLPKGSASSTPSGECTVEVANSSRSTCKLCGAKISKGTVRISMKQQGAKGLPWYHVHCFFETSPAFLPEKLSGWETLSEQERADISSESRKFAAANDKASKTKTLENKNEALKEAPSKGTQRRIASEVERKVPKLGGDLSAGEVSRRGTGNGSTDLDSNISVEGKLEKQTRALWAIKDELKKQVTLAELREMLESNDQEPRGSEYDLRERCADGMMFGALEKCPLCSGSLYYSGGQYSCLGYLTAWSKCTYATREPARAKSKWKIPEESDNEYLCKWFKSQPLKKPVRVLPPAKLPSNEAASGLSEQSGNGRLSGLKVCIIGELKKTVEDWRSKLDDAGVLVHLKIKKDTDCLIAAGELENSNPEVKKARRMKIPIVREDYLSDCIKRQKRLPFNLYKVELGSEMSGGTITVKVKGRSAVHEASGLQDSGHILEDGTSIYNTTMNMSDLSTGINSYYILQIIEEDKGSDCYVFRKWGRVGNEKIGGSKLEEMPKLDAIREFKRLFNEKTGNPWEAWEKKENFQKQPGRFFPLDIDYGVKQLPKKPHQNNEESLLDPRVVALMKMLFDIETYREAMMEFEINLSEMPLVKLSRINIQKGFEVLTEIQNFLNDTKHHSAANESLIVDASNRFFTLIPSIHPHIIRDEDDFKAKVKMLEALQDIEIASRLVGFDCDNDESLDEKYNKLQCNIIAIPHDSEDYKLVEKYLLNTHAPTHKDWTLEVEDVFALERHGEYDKYATYRDKLQNKMLLWHGSRLTNFVGILSQGLRIAPPEAPATGYMFGKGIYFADLVSKSAQYCFVDKKNPVGLMLLSEVALGEMYELKKASYMDKPPRGKHSTKGLGKTVPLQDEYVMWRKDVVIPCGRPVSSSVRASELLYNEYIVYDTAQVKMQFLLKVRFHHKR